MVADGALDKKLEAYRAVSEMYAKAIGEYRGAWVPQFVMGSSGGNGQSAQTTGGGATEFISLLTMKAAKDLGLDLQITSQDEKTGAKTAALPTAPR